MRIDACPACDSRDLRPVGKESHSLAWHVGGEDFTQPAYQLLRCRVCDLYFKSQVMDQATLARYYQRVDFGKWSESEWSPIEELCSRWLAEVPPGGAILDYGCSTGRLLAPFAATRRCYGVEVNVVAAEQASRCGIRMVEESTLTSLEPLDAVVLSDVYEHLLHPANTAVRLLELLRPGGLLMLASGDAGAWPFRVQKGDFWYFQTPEHVSMVTRRHLRYLARRGGAELLECHQTSHYRFGARSRARQAAELVLYALMNGQFSRAARPILRLVPGVRRALRWRQAPVVTGFHDHLVATLRRATGP